MKYNEQDRFQGQDEAKRLMLCTLNGLKSIPHDKSKAAILAAYLTAVVLIDLFFFHASFGETALGSTLHSGLFRLFYTVAAALGFWAIVAEFGLYFSGKIISGQLKRIGLVDDAGIAPMPVGRFLDSKDEHTTVTLTEYLSPVPLHVWKEQQTFIETALNVHVAKVKQGHDLRQVLLYTVPASKGLSDMVLWQDKYLSEDNFVITLGLGLLGPVTINLSKIYHWLIGGSTGSGKSVLLKLILMQCIRKQAVVILGDFKGGLDYSAYIWHSPNCTLITDRQKLHTRLCQLEADIKSREMLCKAHNCENMDEVNRKCGTKYPRIVVAVDEVAVLLQKSGSKEDRALVTAIEDKLKFIAQQGRAYNVNLILALQRPVATFIDGQIRSNLTGKIAGRCDKNLALQIMETTEAAERVPSDGQGRFLLNDEDGTLFQAFYWDDTALEEGGGDHDRTD